MGRMHSRGKGISASALPYKRTPPKMSRKTSASLLRRVLRPRRIHRFARYYKKTKKLPPVWKYESTTPSTLVA